MFSRKNRRGTFHIDAFDGRGVKVVDCDAVEYALPEAVVLQLSTEYFGDPEPCEIHRAAVQKLAVMELIDACGLNRRRMTADLPERLRSYFSAEIHALCIRGDEE